MFRVSFVQLLAVVAMDEQVELAMTWDGFPS